MLPRSLWEESRVQQARPGRIARARGSGSRNPDLRADKCHVFCDAFVLTWYFGSRILQNLEDLRVSDDAVGRVHAPEHRPRQARVTVTGAGDDLGGGAAGHFVKVLRRRGYGLCRLGLENCRSRKGFRMLWLAFYCIEGVGPVVVDETLQGHEGGTGVRRRASRAGWATRCRLRDAFRRPRPRPHATAAVRPLPS